MMLILTRDKKIYYHSCLVSGESGAGKTETAKYFVNHVLSNTGGDGELERRIKGSNPMLEAFGNAKTALNDNSSRFGKFLEIVFDKDGKLSGVSKSSASNFFVILQLITPTTCYIFTIYPLFF